MTPDEINQLEGAELAAAVAEQVMGLELLPDDRARYRAVGETFWVQDYPGDISQAMAVENKMRADGYVFECRHGARAESRFYHIGGDSLSIDAFVVDDSLAVAICRAALLAVGKGGAI